MSAGRILDSPSPVEESSNAGNSPGGSPIVTPIGSPLGGPTPRVVTSTPMRPRSRTDASPSPPYKRSRLDDSLDQENVGRQTQEILNEYKRENMADISMRAPQLSRRLVLRKLVLKNFKSYAGEQVIGPFNDSFNAVVGPNGSGKSNVIDSLLFVFGFKSSQLRHANVTGLIHASAGYKPNECSVEVHFCEVADLEDGVTEDIADTELVVSRKVVRDPKNDSYYMNFKKCSKKEITTTLLEKGIDLTHRRFLILQGEVESIAMMKPKSEDGSDGLLEYLEDIIGTSRYVEELEQIEEKLHAAMDTATLYEREFSVAESQYLSLDRQRLKRLRGFTGYNNAITARYKLHRNNIAELEETRKELENTAAELRTKLEELGALDSEARSQLKKLEADRDATAAAKQDCTNELEELGKRSKVAKIELAKVETLQRQLLSRTTKTESDLKAREAQVNRAKSWLGNFNGDLADVENKQEYLGEQLEAQQLKLQEIRAQIHTQTAPILAQIEQKQLESEPTQAAIEEAKVAIKRCTDGIALSEERVKQAMADKDKAKSTLKTIAERGEHIVSRKKELVVQLTAVGSDTPDFGALEAEYNRLRKENLDAQARLQDASERASNVQSQGRIGDALTKFSNDHNLTDFYGRLGSLGSIEREYDVAVSTACPRLDNYVCGTVGTAQKCMDYLRQSKIGRATFMVLEKLGEPQAKNPAHKAPRLFDLIKRREPKFDKAFFFATGQTLVTPDLASARQAAFSGPRVKTVSKKGEVVDVSGAMTGGGRAMAGKMGATIANAAGGTSRADLDRIRQEASRLHQEFKAAEQKLNQARATHTNCEDARRDLKQQLAQVKLEVDSHAAVFDEHKARYSSEKQSCADVETRELKRSQDLQRSLDTSAAELEKLTRVAAKFETAVAALREQILKIGGTELRECDSRVKDYNERMAQLRLQEQEMHAEKRRLTASLVQDKEDCELLQQSLKKLFTDRAELEDQIAEFQETIKNAASSEKELEAKRASLEDKINDLEQQAEEIRSALGSRSLETQQLEADLEKTETSATAAATKISAIKTEKDKLKFMDLTKYRNLIKEEPLPEFKFEDVESEETNEDLSNAEKINMEIYFKCNPSEGDDFIDEYIKHIPEYTRWQKEVHAQHEVCTGLKTEQQRCASKRLSEFMAGFDEIKRYLRIMYRQINNDGQADLEFVDSQNPFMGIEFTVQPPGKSWKNISNLSGGEKTLSSLSLVFALHQYKPTPLYVMDEIDAALDIRNVDTIARYITRNTKCGQFVVISLRSHMFEKAKRMIGIYKWDDRTESATFDP